MRRKARWRKAGCESADVAAGASQNAEAALRPPLMGEQSIAVASRGAHISKVREQILVARSACRAYHSPMAAMTATAAMTRCAPSSALPASEMRGTWESSMRGSGAAQLSSACVHRIHVGRPARAQPRMGPGASKDGIFAPLVILTRNIVGTKRFNQFRGKGIALHSQVITEFCKQIGADSKQRQGLIRLAKKNGEKLGFLA